jgi:MarR family multiple antibiotic resistance transcriptional regulator
MLSAKNHTYRDRRSAQEARGATQTIGTQTIRESAVHTGSAATDLDFETSVGHVLGDSVPSVGVSLTRVLKPDGISYRQWIILRALCELGTTTATELARRFGYGTGSLSRLIEALARRDLLQRLRTDGDRRVVVLSPTANGAALVDSNLPRVTRTWNGILRRFETAEVHLLVSLLRRLEDLEVGRLGEEEFSSSER